MINPNPRKKSIYIRLARNLRIKCNKYISKGYLMSMRFLNTTIKIGLSIKLMIIILSPVKPREVMNEFPQNQPNKTSVIE